jgi:hypothetical protein
MMTMKPKLVSDTEFKIDKGAKLPADQHRKVYPFAQMEVGDSFHFPAALYPKICAAASYSGTRNGKKFSLRKDGDGYRCWRIA